MHVLFDTGSTHSFIAPHVLLRIPVVCSPLPFDLSITTPGGVVMLGNEIVRDCEIGVHDQVFLGDLIVLAIQDFDVLLGMNWLSRHYAQVDCRQKVISFEYPGQPVIVYRGVKPVVSTPMISIIHAEKLIRRGCEAYLAFVTLVADKMKELTTYPVVRNFSNVFPEELPGLLPYREINFAVDLVLGTQPIFKTPYRMVANELKELKMQLQDLLGRGFIRPSTSPWGDLVLFVRKKDGSMRLCINYR